MKENKNAVSTKSKKPDWSFQDDAIRACRMSLEENPNKKVGLVIPTGGGKTRTALKFALQWLNCFEIGNIVWLTHRKNLRDQAHTELQEIINENPDYLPAKASSLLQKRIEFLMLSQLGQRLEDQASTPVLVIVDEAHHAAAESYQPIFETTYPLNGLFLTATPNRTDDLPIGIDEIAYSITFGELESRGVLVRPTFEEFPVKNFDWDEEQVQELATKILQRAKSDFEKVLIITPRKDKAVLIYSALQRTLDVFEDHPLFTDDVGYIFGDGNSYGISNPDFLNAFKIKPRGIYVSSQLLLEGFNDPGINTVFITYPSGSLIQLMQAVGRCVRYKPNKQNAYVVQARNDDLAYYFDQRWLYQEISDELRPALINFSYSSHEELAKIIVNQLNKFNISETCREQIMNRLNNLKLGKTCRLMLMGLPYFGSVENFEKDAEWRVLLEDSSNSEKFRWIFNDFCARGASTSNPEDFLTKYSKKFGIRRTTDEAGEWRSYNDLLTAMYQAKEEICGQKDIYKSHRPYKENGATTWLRYITFNYIAKEDVALLEFLSDCYNSKIILSSINNSGIEKHHAVIKIKMPLNGFEAYLLRKAEFNRFSSLLDSLRQTLFSTPEEEVFSVYESEISKSCTSLPLPLYVIRRLDFFLENSEDFIFLI